MSHLCCPSQEAVQCAIDCGDLKLSGCGPPVIFPHGILEMPQLCVHLLCSVPDLSAQQTTLMVQGSWAHRSPLQIPSADAAVLAKRDSSRLSIASSGHQCRPSGRTTGQMTASCTCGVSPHMLAISCRRQMPRSLPPLLWNLSASLSLRALWADVAASAFSLSLLFSPCSFIRLHHSISARPRKRG